MKIFLYACLAVLGLALPAFAISNNLAWDVVAPDAATAQGYIWRVYLDGSATGQILTGVTCTGTTTITCQVPYPTTFNGVAVSSGNHPTIVSAQPNATTGVEVQSLATVFQVPGQSGNLRSK